MLIIKTNDGERIRPFYPLISGSRFKSTGSFDSVKYKRFLSLRCLIGIILSSLGIFLIGDADHSEGALEIFGMANLTFVVIRTICTGFPVKKMILSTALSVKRSSVLLDFEAFFFFVSLSLNCLLLTFSPDNEVYRYSVLLSLGSALLAICSFANMILIFTGAGRRI